MRVSLLLLVLSFALVVENANADKLDLAPLLKLGLRFVLLNLKREETITVSDDVTWSVPEEYKNISTGSINLKNAEVFGFQTLDIVNIDANDIDPSNENYVISVCVNLLFDQLGFSSNYDADIGIIDEVPVYGDGKIILATSQVILDLCLEINSNTDFSNISVNDVALGLELHDSPSSITRFWKSDSVSDIVTAIINILEKVIFMFLDYEKDCISSLISPIVQYALNSILPNDLDDKLVINSTCLETIFGQEAEVNLDGTLQNLLFAYNEGRITNLISTTDAEQVKKLIEKINGYILDILTNEGFSIDA